MTAFEVPRPSNPTNHPRRPEFDLDAIESETGFLQACSNNPELRALGGNDIEITPGKRSGSCVWHPNQVEFDDALSFSILTTRNSEQDR